MTTFVCFTSVFLYVKNGSSSVRIDDNTRNNDSAMTEKTKPVHQVYLPHHCYVLPHVQDSKATLGFIRQEHCNVVAGYLCNYEQDPSDKHIGEKGHNLETSASKAQQFFLVILCSM